MDISTALLPAWTDSGEGLPDRAILDQSPDGFCLLDRHGRILDANEAFVRRTGYSRERLLTMHLGQLEAACTLSQTTARLAAVAHDGRDQFETLYRSRDGGQWHAEVTAVWSTHSGGRVLLFIRDITRRVHAEVELRAGEERLRLALDAACTVAWEVDLVRGELLQVGPVASVFGMPTGGGHASLADFLASVHPDDRQPLLDAVAAGAGGDRVEAEFRVPLPDGSERLILGAGTLTRDEAGRAVLVRGTARDVTESRRLRASLSETDRLSTMGLLAAGLAHELNNPLAYLLYHLGTVASDLPALLENRLDLPDDVREQLNGALWSLREALGGAEQIREISRGLGAFARAEDGEARPIDLEVPLRQAMGLVRNTIKYRARLVTELAPALPRVMATEGKLAQAFLNLLLNAAQAMDGRQPEANEILVRSWLEADDVCVEVRDTGCGIAPEHLAHIFEPFFTTKPVGVGSGLGLSIGRAIVAGYCGEMECTSEPGRGTSFVVRLPALPELPVGAVAKPMPPATTGGHVLVVDDDAGIRHGLERMLGRSHEVTTARSVAEAQRLLAGDVAYDVVLCDLQMPEQSGTDLHAWLVEHQPALAARFVFLTGGSLGDGLERYVRAADIGLLEKPFDAHAVRAAIDARVTACRAAGAGEGETR